MPGQPERRVVTPEQKKANVRLGLWLGMFAVVTFVAFVVKSALFGL